MQREQSFPISPRFSVARLSRPPPGAGLGGVTTACEQAGQRGAGKGVATPHPARPRGSPSPSGRALRGREHRLNKTLNHPASSRGAFAAELLWPGMAESFSRLPRPCCLPARSDDGDAVCPPNSPGVPRRFKQFQQQSIPASILWALN